MNRQMVKYGSSRSAIRELAEYGRKASEEGRKIYDFSLGNPATPVPERINETLKKLTDTEGVHGYTSSVGDYAARKAVADRLEGLTPEKIFMTCGAAAALCSVFNALITPDRDEIIIPVPFFPEYTVFVTSAGGKPVYAKCREKTFDLDPDEIARLLSPRTVAVLINSPNNPSGAVYTRDSLEKLGRILSDADHTVYIISDEPYREITYGAEVTYIPSVYRNTVICYSYSKSLALPGERIGYAAVYPKADEADDLYYAIAGAARALGYVCAPSLMQKTIAECPDEVCDLSLYRDNRATLYAALTALGFECVRPEGAFYLMVKAPDGSSAEMSRKAMELGLLLVPGDSFGCPDYVRIAYCVPRQTVRDSIPAFARLKALYE